MEKVILKIIPQKYLNHPVKNIPKCNCTIYLEEIYTTTTLLDNKGNIQKDRCEVQLNSGKTFVVNMSFNKLERIRNKHNTTNIHRFEVRGFQKKG